MLKNGIGRYNMFFQFLHKARWILLFVSFSYRIHQYFCSIPRFDLRHVLSSSTNNFAHAQTLSRMSSLSGRMNIARINPWCFVGVIYKPGHMFPRGSLLVVILWTYFGMSKIIRINKTQILLKYFLVHDCGGVKFLKKRREDVQILQVLLWRFDVWEARHFLSLP